MFLIYYCNNHKLKCLVTLFFVCLFSGSTNAQAQIKLEALEDGAGVEDNTYYKDVHNVLAGYQGIYEYSGSDFYFKIKLVKSTMKSLNNTTTWWDVLEGTYQFTKNGVDANYLNDPFDNDLARIVITGIINADSSGLQYFCPDCFSEKWLRGYIIDELNHRSATIYLAKRIVNGEEGLQLGFYYELIAHKEGDPLPAVAHLPEGKFFARKIN